MYLSLSRAVLPPLLSGFLKETAQCPLVIQQQLLIFLLYLLCHNSRGDELKQAIDAVIAPLFATLLHSSAQSVQSGQLGPLCPLGQMGQLGTSSGQLGQLGSSSNQLGQLGPSGQLGPRRGGGYRGSTSVVLNSQFTRSAYLVTAMLRVSYSMNSHVRSVIYPRLLPALRVVAQILGEVCGKSESASNYENCRILWNFVLYAATILRSRKEEYPRFLPMAASLLQQLPAVLQRLAAHPKSTLRTRGETREL